MPHLIHCMCKNMNNFVMEYRQYNILSDFFFFSLFHSECIFFYIFIDNVPTNVYCVYREMLKQKSKITTKLSENSRNKCRSVRFQLCPLRSQRLYCYRFLS